ncbi:hypothetical protein QNI19_19110 [Cytophagaceae bacterium DM2B3-1]|uniref:Lipoprotein n=1 Tax=Xanthocytophaga flava TaxID=3048013 RepID=A0ABT7CMY9_9BACT|nr:hypothetical protein [Xanthocytophaga flavus]MDJ1495057.1 hypothetical protein [Xanthocytophaga flavus]
MKRRNKLILLVFAIMGIVITWFILTKEDEECIYIGLAFGINGDQVRIEVNDTFLHEETFNFKGSTPVGEIDHFMMSRFEKHIMIDKYCSEDTLIKTRFIWNNKKDTIIYVNRKTVKGININCYKGLLNPIYDYRKGGLNYMWGD